MRERSTMRRFSSGPGMLPPRGWRCHYTRARRGLQRAAEGVLRPLRPAERGRRDGAGPPIRLSRAYTRSYQIMRHRLPGLFLALLSVSACSVVSIDLTPRIRPLEESTVEGTGAGKVLLIDLGGVLAEEPLITLESRPQVPLLARVREELEKAEGDDKVKALVLRINSP